MLYMLDTNICIYLMKRTSMAYFERLDAIANDHQVAISSIVLSELQYGVANSQQSEKSQKNLNVLLTNLEVLPYSEQCALFYGELRAKLKRDGAIIGGNDLLIASHALAENAILVTNNIKEFGRVDKLIIENWGSV